MSAWGARLEDFAEGQEIVHARGKTVGEVEATLLSHLSMNTAQAHFNDDVMRDTEFGQRIAFGGVVASLVVGLAYEDTGESAIAELELESVRFLAPVRIGDTLRTSTVVLSSAATSADCGEVVFEHTGLNQDATVVCVVRRRARMARRER